MSLEDWSKADDRADDARARRVVASYAAATLVVGAVLGLGVVFGGTIKKQVFEEEVTVKLVPREAVTVAPAPPPPPPPPMRVASHAPGPKGTRHDSPPKEVPKAPPEEGDPDRPKEEATSLGDPDGVEGGRGRGGGTVAPPAPPPVAAPEPAPPPVLQIGEVSTAPIALEKAMPPYPEEARKQGVEAVVVVKFVVREDGHVEDARIVRGHPLFDASVLASVQGWTFRPATLEGRPVRMVRLVKIPFRLKHA